ncbi:MAG: hypothetical protein Q8934_12360 [Bacillota bacterium]|nr:hypothetical protein [Bacillota bacterium]
MNAFYETLYLELRQIEQEIKKSLQKRNQQAWLTQLIKEELQDIESSISKFEKGNFGQCEISGELIPEDLLKVIPTLKTKNEFQNIESFYRKPFHQ